MQTSVALEAGQVYHLYNRGNNRENLFRDELDYRTFLRLYDAHISGVADTFAYCLLRNHFHLMVRARATTRASEFVQSDGLADPHQAFSNFFNAYAKTFNKRNGRTGRLFEQRFRRIVVDSDAYFAQLVVYIHRNPQRHGFVPDFRKWEWSSYAAHCSSLPTKVERDEVLGWFGGVDQFRAAHLPETDMPTLATYLADDPN